jgi:predicted metal-dependent peptidase
MPRNAPDKVAEDIVRAARAKVSYVRPYFSHAVFSLVLIEADDCPTMGVDQWGRLYYNPKWVRRYSIEEITVILLHELGHKLREHHKRAHALGVTEATFKIANIAQDAEINDDLRDEIKERRDLPQLPEPKDPEILAIPSHMRGPWFPDKLGCEDNDLWEVYYAHLMDYARLGDAEGSLIAIPTSGGGAPQQEDGEGGEGLCIHGRGTDCGSAAHGVKMPWEHGDPGHEGAHEGVSDADWRDVMRLTAEAIQAEHARGRGTVAAGWKAWADTILKPKRIPWEHELSGGLRWAINDVSGMVLHSYKRPSRRASAMPDIVTPCMRRPIPFVCVVGDTSGSMDEKTDLPLVRGTVEDLCLALGARVAFLATDAEVHGGVQRVGDGKSIELRGRGGTNMCKGIEYAMTNLRPRPDVLVIITDCGTAWPASAPKGVKVIVCAVGDNETDIANVPKWARLIRVRPNDE